MIELIVSGGQTGVDQAGLKIANEMGIPISGWCTKEGIDENGVCILDKYPSLREANTADPSERTRLNIRDSDGTSIRCWLLNGFYFNWCFNRFNHRSRRGEQSILIHRFFYICHCI